MQDPQQSRKRPAPGTSPSTQQPPAQQSNTYQPTQLPENNDYSNFDFTTSFPTDQKYPNPSAFGPNSFNYGQNQAQPQTYTGNLNPATSTDLVRRARNQPLTTQSGQQGSWQGYGSMTGQNQDEDEQSLEQKAALAKKDAQGKRKQIPPFVQKLSSFLDSNNTDLIRWSDDGRSFIVIDEDEFARTLIPELFKHNNYASFVRQLNMYGFHKTVNITDGSLRQSEKARKGVKPPSMYSHPYFRKNRPDLLWLIQKPSAKTNAKRKRDGTIKDQYDSDEDRQSTPIPDNRPQDLSLPRPSQSQDLTPLPRNEIAAVRQELSNLQKQQNLISEMIKQLKQQNDQFYRQATAFQTLHDRHENSINAILSFLATFYKGTGGLDGHGAQNLVNMFTNAQNQQHGSVVEEYNDAIPEGVDQMPRFSKKPQLLLQGPQPQADGSSTGPPSIREMDSPTNDASVRGSVASGHPDHQQTTNANSPVVKSDAPTPNVLGNVPEHSQSADSAQMMSLINNANATSASSSKPGAPAVDFNSIVDQYQSNTGLTPQQRDDIMSSVLRQGGNSQSPSNANGALAPAPQIPDFNTHLKQSQDHLEMLTNMQKQQDEKVSELNRRISPLTPGGSIPGVPREQQDPFDNLGAAGDYDPNAFLDFGDSNNWDGVGAEGGENNTDFDFGFDTANAEYDGTSDPNWDWGTPMFGSAAGGGGINEPDRLAPGGQNQQGDGTGGRVESVSSTATSPAGAMEEPGTPNKRKRTS